MLDFPPSRRCGDEFHRGRISVVCTVLSLKSGRCSCSSTIGTSSSPLRRLSCEREWFALWARAVFSRRNGSIAVRTLSECVYTLDVKDVGLRRTALVYGRKLLSRLPLLNFLPLRRRVNAPHRSYNTSYYLLRTKKKTKRGSLHQKVYDVKAQGLFLVREVFRTSMFEQVARVG